MKTDDNREGFKNKFDTNSKFKKGDKFDRDSKFKKGGKFGDKDSKFKKGDRFGKDKKFAKRGAKFDKFNKKEKGGDKKWPGGRGGNPRYGIKSHNEGEASNSFSDRKPKKVMGSKIQKGKKHNKKR